MFTAHIDNLKCQNCGLCQDNYDLFDLAGEETTIKTGDISHEERIAIAILASQCPVKAIEVIQTDY